MAEIIDVRNSDGYLVVLGSGITLPTSSAAPSGTFPPYPGTIRWNPSGSGEVEYFNTGSWNAFSGSGGSGLTSVNLTGDATGDTGSGGTLPVTLASVATAGTYSNISIDVKGRVISARALNETDITTALTYTPANISSPTFTGTPSAPTPSSADNSTKLATTAYVQSNIHKTVLNSSTSFYVSTTGSDSNPGTSGSPYATITQAYNNLVNKYNLNGYNVTINVANGTYTENITIAGVPEGVGNNNINIVGNNTVPSDVVFNSTNNSMSILNGAFPVVSGITLSSANGDGMFLQGNASVSFGSVGFGACPNGFHIQAGGTGSYIFINGPYTINGAAQSHYLCGTGSEIVVYSTVGTVTISLSGGGTMNFPQGFAYATSCGVIDVFSGVSYYIPGGTTVTGTKSYVKFNAVINTNGNGGSTFFPGNINGVASNGGQYG